MLYNFTYGLHLFSVADTYDGRKDKPSVLVTSPGSPDLHASHRPQRMPPLTNRNDVGGRMQVKICYKKRNFYLHTHQ